MSPLRVAPWLLAMAVSPSVYAQTTTTNENLEDRQPDIEQEKKLEARVFFETEWHEYNNLDFRALDETTDQTILDSDDRNELAFTGAGIQLAYQADKNSRFVLGASHQGLWANDQIGLTNMFGGVFYFNALYAELKTNGDNPIVAKIGRQPFNLGGVPRNLEFTFSDIVDQVLVEIPVGSIGKVVLIPINVAALAAQDDATFMSFVGQADIETFGFRGDRLTRRHGLQFILDEINGPIDMQAYAFYTDIGSLGSGSDVTYDGRLGNVTDGDWVANAGARVWGEFGPVRPFLAVDASVGVDRKETVAPDVDTNGVAGTLGAEVITGDEDKGFRGQFAGYYALGPAYGPDGMKFSHGYVGMKGRQIGGTLANRYLGWHPSAYVGTFGVNSDEHRQGRTSGSLMGQVTAGYDFGKVDARIGYWFMADTGFTEITDFGDGLDEITPPFGYAREEFAAQDRLGKVLGNEIDLDVGYSPTDNISFFVNGAVMLPGGFYAIEIARVAGDQLGSDNPQMPWGAYAGTRVRFQ